MSPQLSDHAEVPVLWSLFELMDTSGNKIWDKHNLLDKLGDICPVRLSDSPSYCIPSDFNRNEMRQY